MNSATISAGTTNYLYNALGQLIEKSGNGGTTLLMYDEAGHILGEYTATGGLIEETVWMGDTPIATLQPNGGGIAIYYVHTDYLGSPRKITRPLHNGLMWRWDPDPFGTVNPNTNPAGLGAFNYNLRFPGQYSLNESGLYYNYFRDYDPTMGRYIESDRIGLQGGVNTYAYVGGNPVSNIDPLGLWSVTIGGYAIVGTELSFGFDNGHFFVTDRWGFGLGGGIGYDPEGGIPGGTRDTGCRGGVVLSDSVQASASLGPYAAGTEVGVFRNYTTGISDTFGSPPHFQGDGEWRPVVRGVVSLGGQITLYTGVH